MRVHQSFRGYPSNLENMLQSFSLPTVFGSGILDQDFFSNSVVKLEVLITVTVKAGFDQGSKQAAANSIFEVCFDCADSRKLPPQNGCFPPLCSCCGAVHIFRLGGHFSWLEQGNPCVSAVHPCEGA